MNPFSYGTIVRGDNFYDRKEETKRIVDTLTGGNNVVLFAPRRYGKTSLVFKVMENLEKKGYACIYFDLMQAYSLESFVQLYISAIEKKESKSESFFRTLVSYLRTIKPVLTVTEDGKPKLSLDFNETKISAKTISDVLDLPQHLAEKGKKLIIVMDEFQEINKFDKYGLEQMLRSKVQMQDVKYLFLGSKTHILTDMFSNKKRPFYNSALNIQITALPEKDTINFLQDRFFSSQIKIDTNACKYIINKTMNIPYYIQLLASEVWQYVIEKKNEVTLDIIDICVQRVVTLKTDYYYELFDRHSLVQKKLLKALSEQGENIFSADYTNKYRLGAVSTVQKAANVLLENGIIDKDKGTYFISDPFYKMYIEQYC